MQKIYFRLINRENQRLDLNLFLNVSSVFYVLFPIFKKLF